MAEKRSIFEEVTETQKPAATPGGVSGGAGRARAWGRRAMRVWLQILFVARGHHDRRGWSDAAD
jgi:hypothetical protein